MAAVGFDDLAVVTVSDGYLEKMKAELLDKFEVYSACQCLNQKLAILLNP